MATIDIKLKTYDELIFEITKLNTDKYLLEQENKQLKEEIETLKDGFDFNLGAIENIRKGKNELEEKIDKAIEYIKEYGRDKQLEEEYLMNAYNLAMYNITLLEILGEKDV